MTGSVAGRPRLVATDLDGTLLRSDGALSARTRAAIAAAEHVGIQTIFVTARPPRWMHDVADAVGGHGVAICGNGSFVFEAATREVTSTRGHRPGDLQRLIADLRREFPDVALAVERADGYAEEERFELSGSPVGKLLARSADTDPDHFIRRVVELTAGRAEVGFSGAVGLAEMTAPGVTKASGLAAWCVEQGVDAGAVWACGDMPNDLPMLAWAGRAFAVANAHPEVLAAAHHVLPSNDEDAVAGLLESLL